MERKKATYVDGVFVLTVVLIIAVALFQPNKGEILTPVLLCLLGLAFLLCNKFKDVSFIARLLSWFSDNLFVPRNKYSHIIWGVILIGLGTYSALFGPGRDYSPGHEAVPQHPGVQEFQSWWYKDPVFWIIIVLLIFIGIYRSKSKGK